MLLEIKSPEYSLGIMGNVILVRGEKFTLKICIPIHN